LANVRKSCCSPSARAAPLPCTLSQDAKPRRAQREAELPLAGRQATLRELACADSLEELQHLLAPAARLGAPVGACPGSRGRHLLPRTETV